MSITNDIATGFLASCREPIDLEGHAEFDLLSAHDSLMDALGILSRSEREQWRDELDALIAAMRAGRRAS